LLQEESDDIISVFGATGGNSRSGSRSGNDATSRKLGSGSGRSTTVREIAAHAIAHGVRSRADALGGVICVVWHETILATEVAWLLDITNRLAVVRVVALLVSGLA